MVKFIVYDWGLTWGDEVTHFWKWYFRLPFLIYIIQYFFNLKTVDITHAHTRNIIVRHGDASGEPAHFSIMVECTYGKCENNELSVSSQNVGYTQTSVVTDDQIHFIHYHTHVRILACKHRPVIDLTLVLRYEWKKYSAKVKWENHFGPRRNTAVARTQ